MDPFNSSTVSLLCELEDAALLFGRPLDIVLTSESRMRIEPREILTPERTQRIRRHRDTLAVLVAHVLTQGAGHHAA